MKTRSSVAGLLSLVLLSGPGLAAAPEVGVPSLDRFVQPLGLTAEQQRRLAPVFAEAQAKAKAMSPEDAAALRPERETDFRVKLAAVLKPEQLVEYDRLTSARPAETAVVQPAHGHRNMNDSSTPSSDKGASTTPPAK